ncbi:hypothetical protein JHK82_012027 [Glycine max]|nr:hypothetical protein JHK86_012019 [Glycine max]KAG5154058.1 hypothetical protein JHK82_012027 [Glycine max]
MPSRPLSNSKKSASLPCCSCCAVVPHAHTNVGLSLHDIVEVTLALTFTRIECHQSPSSSTSPFSNKDASGSVKLWEITKGVVIEDYQSCGRQLVSFEEKKEELFEIWYDY